MRRLTLPSAIVLFLVWVGLIVATSSTVVRPQEFFGMVQYLTGAEADTLREFKAFWAISWFAVVKGWHFTEFGILTLLCTASLNWWRGKHDLVSIGVAVVCCMLFAISDEWHQSFVPDRFGTVMDVCIDSAGVLTAGTILTVRNLRRRGDRVESKTNDDLVPDSR